MSGKGSNKPQPLCCYGCCARAPRATTSVVMMFYILNGIFSTLLLNRKRGCFTEPMSRRTVDNNIAVRNFLRIEHEMKDFWAKFLIRSVLLTTVSVFLFRINRILVLNFQVFSGLYDVMCVLFLLGTFHVSCKIKIKIHYNAVAPLVQTTWSCGRKVSFNNTNSYYSTRSIFQFKQIVCTYVKTALELWYWLLFVYLPLLLCKKKPIQFEFWLHVIGFVLG